MGFLVEACPAADRQAWAFVLSADRSACQALHWIGEGHVLRLGATHRKWAAVAFPGCLPCAGSHPALLTASPLSSALVSWLKSCMANYFIFLSQDFLDCSHPFPFICLFLAHIQGPIANSPLSLPNRILGEGEVTWGWRLLCLGLEIE